MKAHDHLKAAEAFAKLLDSQFKILGFRFGLDPLIGFVPVLGDAVSMGLSFYLIWIGKQLKIPEEAINKMVANVFLDFVIGAVPGLGEVADFFFKANQKNFEILRAHANPEPIEGEVISG